MDLTVKSSKSAVLEFFLRKSKQFITCQISRWNNPKRNLLTDIWIFQLNFKCHLIASWTFYQPSSELDSMRSTIRPEKSRRKFKIGQRWRSTPAVFAHFRSNDSSDRLALKKWNVEHFTKNKLMQIWLKSDDNWRNYSHFSIFNSKILTRFQLN